MEIVKRGLDSFRPGQIVVLGFVPLMDENVKFEENSYIKEDFKLINKLSIKEKIDPFYKEQVKKAARIPALIVKKIEPENDLDIPVYDVIFWNRTRGGELLGYNTIINYPVWRYLSGDVVEEGTPPNWFIEMLLNNVKNPDDIVIEDYNIKAKDICYIKPGPKGDGSDDYWYYLFDKEK